MASPKKDEYMRGYADGFKDGVASKWTEHQLAKLSDFKGCLDEHEAMRCASTAQRVREAALDFALAVVVQPQPPVEATVPNDDSMWVGD